MTTLALLLLTLAAQPEPTLPPPPPPLEAAPEAFIPAQPVRDENGVAMLANHPARVRVHLSAVAPEAELYDVSTLMTLCRAPCGVWLDTDENHRYQVRAKGVTPSSEFGLSDFSGEVAISFQHRNELMRGFGLASTIVGAVGIIGGAVLALGWLIVIGFVNLFVVAFGGKPVVGAFEILYAAAIAAGAGGAFLTPGLILMLGGGREKLSVDGVR